MSGSPSQNSWDRVARAWRQAPNRRLEFDNPPTQHATTQLPQNSDNHESLDDGGVKLEIFATSQNFGPSSRLAPPSRPVLRSRTSNTHLNRELTSNRAASSSSTAANLNASAEAFRSLLISTPRLGISGLSPLRQPLLGSQERVGDRPIGFSGLPLSPFEPIGNASSTATTRRATRQFDVYRDRPEPIRPLVPTPTPPSVSGPGSTAGRVFVPSPIRRRAMGPVLPVLPGPAEGPASSTPREIRYFKPMSNLGNGQDHRSGGVGREVTLADASAFSVNYRGEKTLKNASVDNLPAEKNCALWLTNLPPKVTYNELLSALSAFGPLGRIFCTVINYPDYARHQTAAAKVVFFQPEPAQKLRLKALREGLIVGGNTIKVAHNRVKHAEQPMGEGTRVLIITGDADYVNERFLHSYFGDQFTFNTDSFKTLVYEERCNRAVLEIKFGSYRCQAQMGKMALDINKPEWLMKVEFGQDPCEIGHELSSYGVAGLRIQGLGI